MAGQPYKVSTFVAGAKSALKHRGFTDSEIYDTLLSMGIRPSAISHIVKEESDKKDELKRIKRNKKK